MNNTFTISSPSYSIDWSPKTVVEEVLQNVSTIINTQIGTVPYARKLGINSSLVDSPSPIFIATATREIIQKLVSLSLERLSILLLLKERTFLMVLLGQNL